MRHGGFRILINDDELSLERGSGCNSELCNSMISFVAAGDKEESAIRGYRRQ